MSTTPQGSPGSRPVLLDAAATTRCRRRVHLEHDPSAGLAAGAVDGVLPEPDPGVEMRRADAAEHRAQLARRWAAALGDRFVSVPHDAARPARLAATLAALEQEAHWIGGAELPPGAGRRGGAELLVRAEAGGWHPVIVVRHRVTDAGSGARTSPIESPYPAAAAEDPERKVRTVSRDVLRLAHLHRMLGEAGLAPAGGGPVWAGLVGLDADAVVWFDLAEPSGLGGVGALDTYDRRHADRLAVATAAREGGPALAEPSRITECRRCPWWPTCEAALRARDDVSLVVRGDDALRLRGVGVATVRQLAALDPARGLPPRTVGGTGDAESPEDGRKPVDLRESVALARAWRSRVPLVRRVRRPDVPRANVEVDVDMESLGEDGAYLWGALLSGVGVGLEPGYRGFVTWDPLPTRDEGRSFGEFWAWLDDVRARADARGLSVGVYCYNEQAENRWLRASAERFAGMAGVPTPEAVEEFIDSPEWIDLFPAVSEQFLCPHGKGLKRIAPSAGFSWRDPEAGGENSMRWYRAAVALDAARDGEPDLSQRDRLLAYNEDDVRATHALRTWMTSARVLDVPYLDDLPADPADPAA